MKFGKMFIMGNISVNSRMGNLQLSEHNKYREKKMLRIFVKFWGKHFIENQTIEEKYVKIIELIKM